MKDLKEIEIKYIKEVIPDILYIKLEKFKLITLNDIDNFSVEDFRKLPYVGKKVEKLFIDLKVSIKENAEELNEIYTKNLPKTIPFNYSEELNVLQIIEFLTDDLFSIIESFKYSSIKAKKRNTRNIDIIKKSFGLKSKKYDRDKIAKRHLIDRERVRQIEEDFVVLLRRLLNGNFIEEWKCNCNAESINIIQSFQKEIVGTPIISEYIISFIFKDYGINEHFLANKNYLFLFLRVWGFENVPLSRHYKLQKNNFFVDASVDNESFLNIALKILGFLEKKVIPTSFDDIVIEVREYYNQDDDFIRLICNSLQEIEELDNHYYQIKFECLSSINDYAYRLLFEKQRELSCNELLLLINKRLVHFNKALEIDSLKSNLRKNEYITPIGKTGSWALVELNKNIDSQINLILKTFRILDKPLKISEITNFINDNFSRNDVNSRSITSNLWNYRKYFIRLKGNRYSLVETKDKYISEVIDYKPSVKSTKTTITDEISNKTIDILNNRASKSILLTELARLLSQANGYTRMAVYKAISSNPLIFKKEQVGKKEKVVSLIIPGNQSHNDLTSKYKWNELKTILERELNPIFISSTQPSYSISLSEALDVFFKILTLKVPSQNKEISDLADRILPTLYKFYIGASDRNDKLNFLKQIVTSQESFFKKLLFFVDKANYILTKNNKSGFGVVIDFLPKIDSRKNRYKDLRTATLFEFGKHCSRAYNNRNIDTHFANDWTEAEIIDTKTSCLVFMIYSAFEYYNDIKRI